MKKNKFLTSLLLVVMLAVAVFAFGACDNAEKNPTPTPTPPAQKTYQLIGENTELSGFGFAFYFMMNMEADGKFVISTYNPLTYDSSDAATNKSFTKEFAKGTWRAQKDPEQQDAIQIKITEPQADVETYYAYDQNGTLTFADYKFSFGGSFSRTVTLSGSSTKTHANDNAFIQANKKTFVAPTSVDTFVSADGKVTAYLNEVGKVMLYNGYTKISEGTWTNKDGALAILIGENAVSIELDGTKATFTYELTLGGTSLGMATLICDDITELLAVQLPEASEIVTVPGTGVVAGSAKFFTDGTVKLSMLGGNQKKEGTWSHDGTTVTMIIADPIEDNANNKVTITFTAEDESFVWGSGTYATTFNFADGNVASLLAHNL